MIFESVSIADSQGCYLAHSQITKAGRIPKGSMIDEHLQLQLQEAGLQTVLAARLGSDDLHEDAAATAVAQALAGSGVSQTSARTGRVNVHSETSGLCTFNRQSIITANGIDEGITLSTIAENLWVPSGKMIATVKIIPYGVARSNVHKVIDELNETTIDVSSPKHFTAELIQTRLPALKEQVLDKTRRITERRLLHRHIDIAHEQRCTHDVDALVDCIQQSLQRSTDWILIAGASAISDREDVIPRAIVKAGGVVQRFGIPVDPGNLLLLGNKGCTQIIGLPGCARSPRYNGLDQILDRLACDIAVSDDWLDSLCIGGLLSENADRPEPRIREKRRSSIGALLLAAGSSRRAGSQNKLLHRYKQMPLIKHVVNTLEQSQVTRTVAITGHEQEQVEAVLKESNIECYFNHSHEVGMASSVVCGVSELKELDAIVVCLGDMPHVKAGTINQLIAAYSNNPDKSIFIPVHQSKRGNPVLFSKVLFDTLLTLEGDTGAKNICAQYPDLTLEVETNDAGILLDYDTPQELESLNNTIES